MNLVFLLLSSVSFVSGKIYKRCELARELKTVHKAPVHQLATWVCIAEHESQYRTDAVGHLGEKGTSDHGIFQINDKYWCSPPGRGRACGLTCSQLEDDDITDDFICAQKIYKEHKVLSGDGFNAWAVYQPHCKGSKSAKYVKDCFGGGNNSTKPTGTGRPIWQKPYSSQNIEDKSKTSLPEKNVVNRFSTPKAFESNPYQRTSTTSRRTLPPSTRKPPSSTSFRTSTLSKSTTSTPSFAVRTRLNIVNPPGNAKPVTTSRISNFTPTTSRPSGTVNFNNGNSFRFSADTLGLSSPQRTSPGVIGANESPVKSSPPIQPVFVFNGMKWYR